MTYWPFARWPRRRTPFARLSRKQGVDLAKGTPYEIALQQPSLTPTVIESWVDRLGGAPDVPSRDVLNDLIDAWTDQELAVLDGRRDDARAEANAVLALAAEQVARYQPRYEADLTEVRRTRATLAATLEALTGFKPTDVNRPHRLVADKYPVESTLGPTVESTLEPTVEQTTVPPATTEPISAETTMGPSGPAAEPRSGPEPRSGLARRLIGKPATTSARDWRTND